MMRHRRRQLPRHVVRNVANATAPAVASRDKDGTIVVDVDENLEGAARDDAILAALEPFAQGRLAPVPLFAIMWEAGARLVCENPRATAALAGAGAVAVVGTVGLVITGALDSEQRPAVIAVATVTQAVEPTSATLDPTTPASTPTREPDRTREPATPKPEPSTWRAEPAFDSRPERATQQPPRSPKPSPTRTPKRPASTPSPVRPTAGDGEVRPTPSRAQPDPPTVDEPTSTPQPPPQQPDPEPEPAGKNCRLVDLDVGVGDLLGVGVCV